MIDVTAAIIKKDGLILIAQRNKADKLADLWEFPGGKIEEGETPQKCLQRELVEEFGIETEIGDFFGESIYQYEHGTVRLLVYWVIWRKGQLIPKVHAQVKWALPEGLKDYPFAPADIPLVAKLVNRIANEKH
ncbi:MAG: NUDIX hydrolase [Peptococcaceae bacterium BICA1-8]|nr:MAG: NUDIX hydrolase [Peptococcaceae bacterium BICA1-8]